MLGGSQGRSRYALSITCAQILMLILAVQLAKPHVTCEFKTQEDRHDLTDTGVPMQKGLSAKCTGAGL